MRFSLRRCWQVLPFAGLALGAGQAAAAGAVSAAALRDIDRVLSAAYPANQPGAAVLVAADDRVVLRRGYGLADLERGIRMRPDREFRIASISKQFTAVAVLQLVAAGKLHLEDDAATYAPEFFAQLPGVRITIRQLLTHTSGLKNYSDLDEFRDQPTRAMSVDDILGMVAHRGLRFAPGTSWEYCNTGYLLLGAIVQRVTGEPFAEYLQRRVLGPAGLTQTRVGGAGAAGAEKGIHGYSPVIGQRGAFQRAVPLNLSQAFGAGQLISTVDDLWKWERAVEAGRVLGREWVNEAWTPVALARGGADGPRTLAARAGQNAVGPSVPGGFAPPSHALPSYAPPLSFGDKPGVVLAPYGYGWELETVAHHASVGHGGSLSGYRTYEVEVPDLRLYIAILCNCDRPANDPAAVAGKIVEAAARRLQGS